MSVEKNEEAPRPWSTVGIAAGAVAVLSLIIVAVICSWSAEAWAALAAWVTAAIAVAAGLIALGQLGEARRFRVEQAQPYVVVSMELSAPHSKAIDLVVRNLGATAATEVHFELEPTPKRAAGGEDAADVWLPDSIPVLVPGQEWRTMWDLLPQRAAANLPDRHEAVVIYKDSQGKGTFRFEFALDWSPYKHRASLVVHGTHDAAKALRDISKTIGRWREGHPGGISVFVRDGNAKDQRQRARYDSLEEVAEDGDPTDESE